MSISKDFKSVKGNGLAETLEIIADQVLAVATIIGGTSPPTSEELDCAHEQAIATADAICELINRNTEKLKVKDSIIMDQADEIEIAVALAEVEHLQSHE